MKPLSNYMLEALDKSKSTLQEIFTETPVKDADPDENDKTIKATDSPTFLDSVVGVSNDEKLK